MADTIADWAGLELTRRLERAQTARERSQVYADAARARTNADFRARLAQIAQHGRFQSGGWGAAQLGLAAATVAPYLPVVGSALGPVGTGIGTAAALGLGGIGAANIAEGLQRRSEGLPGTTMQMGLGAADVGLPFLGPASRLLRGLRGAKLPPPAFKRGTTYTIGPVAPEGPGARFQGQRWTPTSHPGRSAAGVPKPQYTAGTAGATGLARTALQKELDELLPTTLEEGVRARRGGTVGRPDPYLADPRVPAQGFQPEVRYPAGVAPPPLGGVGIADAGRAASTGARMGAMPPPAFKRGLTYTGRGPVEGVGPYLGPGRGPMSQFGRPIGPGAGGRGGGGGGTTATPTATPRVTPAVTPAVTPTPTGTVPKGIGAAVVAARAGLTPAARASVDPSLQWLQGVLEKTVTSDVTANLLMKRGIGGEKFAKLLARATPGARKGGIIQYRAFERGGPYRMEPTKTRHKELFAEKFDLANPRRSVEEFNAALGKGEAKAAADELMTSPSLVGVRARLNIGKGLPVPGKKDTGYNAYILSKAGLALKNRAQALTMVMEQMGLLTTEQAARLEALATEGYMRAHHGVATTGRRTKDVAGMAPAVTKGSIGPLKGSKLTRDERPMAEDLAGYLSELQKIVASLGLLFAGIYGAEQLMPQGGVNAAAG